MNTLSTKNSWIHCTRETLILALPVLGAHLIEALIPFINVTLSASLGELSLAAAGLVGSTFLALMGFCWGVTASVGIITANKVGEGSENKKVGLVLWAGFLTTMILSLPVMFIFSNMSKAWILFGQNPQVIENAQAYMNGLLLAVPADLAKFAIFQFAIALGKARIPLIANILSVPLLFILNHFLIQQYGIYGIGLGTAMTYWIVFAAMFAYLLTHSFFKTYLIHRVDFSALIKTGKEQLQLGVPIGLMFSIELIFFMVLTLFMGYLGELTLAANQIAMQWMWLTVMLVYGFTEAVTILVAKANGAKNHHQVIQFTFIGMLLASLSMLMVACLYWFAPEQIIGFDLGSANDSLMQLAVKLLMFCGIYQILDGIRIVISGALRGLEDSKYPMWITAFSFWLVGLPIGYVCAFLFHWDAIGLWIGLISAAIFSTAFQYRRLQQRVLHSVRLATTEIIQEIA